MVFKKGHKTWVGKRHSEETKRKISKAMKGRKTWNKGKIGVYSKATKRKMSESSKGQIPWNKGKRGLQKHTEETKRNMSKARNGRKNPMYGKPRSKATKRKISEAMKGRKKSRI